MDDLAWRNKYSFNLGDGLKAQSLKVLEEASEVHVAVAEYVKALDVDEIFEETGDSLIDLYRQDMLDEFADLHQSLYNLERQLGVSAEEIAIAADRCDERNIVRGRIREV